MADEIPLLPPGSKVCVIGAGCVTGTHGVAPPLFCVTFRCVVNGSLTAPGACTCVTCGLTSSVGLYVARQAIEHHLAPTVFEASDKVGR